MRLLFTIILMSLLCDIYSQSPAFEDEWIPKEFSEPESTMSYTDNASGESVYISVNVRDTVNKILPTIFGNNLPAWRQSLYGNQAMIDHVKRMNMRTMRIPGGNWSNTWLWDGINHWDGSGQDGYSGTFKEYDDTQNYIDVVTSLPTKTWTLTTDQLLQICDDWGVEPQICVNYALARYIDADNAVQQAAHYAAEWVRQVKEQGYNVKYWEIGNEHYGPWEPGYVVEGDTLSGAEYGRDACVFIDSMKAANPDIKIGIVVYPDADYRSMPDYTPEVLQEAGDKADFLITHEYFTWAKDPNDIEYSEILNAIPQIKWDYDTVQSMVKLYTSKDHMPVAMTEYNYTGGLKETEGIASLFFAHALGEYMKNGYGLVNFWDIQNGAGAEDHGMFTLKEDGVDDNIPHPSFFPYYLFNKMFGDALTASTCNSEEIFVYSSRFSNGYAGITVLNESSAPRSITLKVPGYTIGDTVYRYELSTDDLSSRKIYINGTTSPDGELYGPRDYYSIPPYQQFAENNAVKTGIKKYSVNYFVVRLKEYTAIFGHKANPYISLQISPNPSSGNVNIAYSLPVSARTKVCLYNNTGQLLKVLQDETVPVGKHLNRYNLSGLAPGVYIIKLESAAGTDSEKLMIK